MSFAASSCTLAYIAEKCCSSSAYSESPTSVSCLKSPTTFSLVTFESSTWHREPTLTRFGTFLIFNLWYDPFNWPKATPSAERARIRAQIYVWGLSSFLLTWCTPYTTSDRLKEQLNRVPSASVLVMRATTTIPMGIYETKSKSASSLNSFKPALIEVLWPTWMKQPAFDILVTYPIVSPPVLRDSGAPNFRILFLKFAFFWRVASFFWKSPVAPSGYISFQCSSSSTDSLAESYHLPFLSLSTILAKKRPFS